MKFLETIKKGIVDNKAEICLGAGIGLILTGVMAACKASYRVPDILEDHLFVRDEIQEAAKKDEKLDIRTETWKLYAYTGFKIAKEFVMPGIELAGGIALIGYSFNLKQLEIEDLKKQNAGLAATVASIQGGFNSYRDRVRKKYGEEEELKLYNGEEEVEVEDTEVDEKGKEKKVKKKVTVESGSLNMFTRYITRINPLFNEDETMMDFTVRMQENCLNDKLHSKRHDGKTNYLTFNEALEAFAMDTCKEGMVSGWIDDGDVVIIECKKTLLPGETGRPEVAYRITFNCKTDIYSDLT